MAPGNNGALQDGHSTVAAGDGLGGTVGEGEGWGGAGGRGDGASGRGAERACGGATACATAAAATGSRTGAAPTWSAFLQLGHSTCLPTALSGACMNCEQCGQRITNGMHPPLAPIPRSFFASAQREPDPYDFLPWRSPKRRTLFPTRMTSPERSSVGAATRELLR
jgi:hypothetical protein